MQYKITPSFGRRKARKLRENAQTAYQDLLPRVKLESHQQLFDNTSVEVWLEIGFGGGEHFLEQLTQNPLIRMIGCEPFMNGVAKLLSHLLPEDYERVKIWHEDVRYLLDFIPTSYFSRAFILFPDPWPKYRHQRRRLVTQEFMDLLWLKLKDTARLHIASDDPSYVAQIQTVLYTHPGFTLLKGPASADPLRWSARPDDWPETRYERKALDQGKKCAYMIFQKKENAE